MNRRSQLAALSTIWSHDPGLRLPLLAVLRGPAGSGKSALALRWLGTVLDRYPDGHLYVELAGEDGQPISIADTLGSILRALGVPAGDVPDRRDERANLYRSITADLRITMLLEDALSARQVISLLPASGRCAVLITTHRSLSGLTAYQPHVVPVEPLDEPEARELVEATVGDTRLTHDQQATDTILSYCGGLPVALAAVAAYLADHPQRTVTHLATQLTARSPMDTLSLDDAISVRATFDAVYRGLPAVAQRAYLAIGIQPGVLVTPDLLAATRGIAVGQAGAALDDLLRVSLLTEPGPGQFRCHTVIRSHARDLAHHTLDSSELAAMELAALEHILNATRHAGAIVLPGRRRFPFPFETRPIAPPGVDDRASAIAWLDQNQHDIVAALKMACEIGQWRIAYLFAHAVQPLFIVHKGYDVANEVCQLGCNAARRLNDMAGQVDMLLRQVGNLKQLGDLDSADKLVQEAMRQAKTGELRGDVGRVLNCLGGLHHVRLELDDAEDAYRQAVDIAGECDDVYSQALARIGLGTVLNDKGQSGDARVILAAAMEQFNQLPTPDPYNGARAGIELARALRIVGELDQAVRLLAAVEPPLRELGATVALAARRDELARTHAAIDDANRADGHGVQGQ